MRTWIVGTALALVVAAAPVQAAMAAETFVVTNWNAATTSCWSSTSGALVQSGRRRARVAAVVARAALRRRAGRSRW